MANTPLENRLEDINNTIDDIVDDVNDTLEEQGIEPIDVLADVPRVINQLAEDGGKINSVDTTMGLDTRTVIDPQTQKESLQAFAKVDGTTIKFNSNGQMQADIKTPDFIVVAELPIASAQTMGDIYLVPSTSSKTKNVKDEFITIEDNGTYEWEQIGSTAVDLSNYYTKTEADALLDDKLDIADIDDELSATSVNPVQNKVIVDAIQPLLFVPPEETPINYTFATEPLIHNNAVVAAFITADNTSKYVEFVCTPDPNYPDDLNNIEFMLGQAVDKMGMSAPTHTLFFISNSPQVQRHYILSYYIYNQDGTLQRSVENSATTASAGYYGMQVTWSGLYIRMIKANYLVGKSLPETTSMTISGNGFYTTGTLSPSEGTFNYTINGNTPKSEWNVMGDNVRDLQHRVTYLEENPEPADTSMSITSTAPVQNKVITQYLGPVLGNPPVPGVTTYDFLIDKPTITCDPNTELVYEFFGVSNNTATFKQIHLVFNSAAHKTIFETNLYGITRGTGTGSGSFAARDGSFVVTNISEDIPFSYTVHAYSVAGTETTTQSTGTCFTNTTYPSLISIIGSYEYLISGIPAIPYLPAGTTAQGYSTSWNQWSTYSTLANIGEYNFTFNGSAPATPWDDIVERVTNLENNPPSGTVTAGDVDSESATSGYVLTADGSGGASWQAGGGSGVIVDSAMSTTSTNPVQNKIITESIAPLLPQIIDPSVSNVSMTTVDGNLPPCPDIATYTKHFIGNLYYSTDASTYGNCQIGITVTENGADTSDNFDYQLQCISGPYGYSTLVLFMKSKDENTHTVDIASRSYWVKQNGTTVYGRYDNNDNPIISFTNKSIGTTYVEVGRRMYVWGASFGSGSFSYCKDIKNSDVYDVLYDTNLISWNVNILYNGSVDYSSDWSKLQDDVTALKSRENIRTYFDTTTNDLYITNDGSDPTPASN